MGTGKTCVGKTLAARLHMLFVDMDDLIEQRRGKPITRIFAEEGEPFFRNLERALVRELASRDNLVIGAGGGIVLDPDNIRDFQETGLVICLSADPETILARVAGDATRPLLAGNDRPARIRAILQKRQPLYDAIPFRIDTAFLSVEEVADRIARRYRQEAGNGSAA